MKFIYSNKIFWSFIVIAAAFLLCIPVVKVVLLMSKLDFTQIPQIHSALNDNLPLRNILKDLATSGTLLLLQSFVISGLILIIWLNRDRVWSRMLGYASFTFLVIGLMGTLYAPTFNLEKYYQISALMPQEERGTVIAKIQFDSIDGPFKKMLIDAKNGKIRCFVRTHLESNFGYEGFSMVRVNGKILIFDKRNAWLNPKFIENFIENPQVTFEFELKDNNTLVYKDLVPLNGKSEQGMKSYKRRDELQVNNKIIAIPSNQLLIYFLFKSLNGKPLAVFF